MSNAWLIPDSTPTGSRSLVLVVPDDEDWEALVRGALALLLDPDNFEQTGSITPEEAVTVFLPGVLETFTDWTTDA